MKVIPINKVIKEIEHKWCNEIKKDRWVYGTQYYTDGYYDAQRDCIKIIKDNIKEVNGKVYKSK